MVENPTYFNASLDWCYLPEDLVYLLAEFDEKQF